MKLSLYDLSFGELENLVNRYQEPGYRTKQLWAGLYQHNWDHFDGFSNIPQAFRSRIRGEYDLSNIRVTNQIISRDGYTEKVLFTLSDGNQIEAVLMQYNSRHTVCVSTQAGCAMGCVFCATGQMGFFRNLTSGEIVQQVIYFNKILKKINKTITNVVFMGMGEPFHNYDEVLKAIYQLNHPDGMNLGARRFTISTVGLIPAINRFATEKHQVNLAVSLHASSDELRVKIIPLARKYPLLDLISACKYYVDNTGRRISFEWALIRDTNDSVQEANRLSDLLIPFLSQNGALCHVNVIPLNETRKYSGSSSDFHQVKKFCGVLNSKGIPCSIRIRRGLDIQAGCGQLAVAGMDQNRK